MWFVVIIFILTLKEIVMKNFKKVFFVMFVALALILSGMSDVFAKSSGSGSRSSGSSSRSGGFSRPSKPSSSAPSKPSSVKPSSDTKSTKPSTSTRSTAAPARTPTQQKSYEAAKQNGTAFKSKAEATASFKQANATKYTSKYTTEPSTRPTYIPQTTAVGGTNVNISYNAGMGGYGYMHPSLGTFMLYDALSDAAMVSVLMSHDNYYYDDPNQVVNHRSGVVARSGPSFMSIVYAVVFAITFIAVVIIIGKKFS